MNWGDSCGFSSDRSDFWTLPKKITLKTCLNAVVFQVVYPVPAGDPVAPVPCAGQSDWLTVTRAGRRIRSLIM